MSNKSAFVKVMLVGGHEVYLSYADIHLIAAPATISLLGREDKARAFVRCRTHGDRMHDYLSTDTPEEIIARIDGDDPKN